MDSWLATAKALADAHTPFVLATVWKKSGYSPDDVGSRLLVTANDVFGDLISTNRRKKLTESARKLLDSQTDALFEQYPLGNILGTANGSYEVMFARFRSSQTPEWLTDSYRLQLAGDRFVLMQSVKRDENQADSFAFQLVTQTQEASNDAELKALNLLASKAQHSACEVLEQQQTETMLQLIREPVINIAVLGAGDVATNLIEQLKLLPVSIHWFAPDSTPEHSVPARQGKVMRAPLQEGLFSSLPNRTRLVIATGDHETDLRYCQLALQSDKTTYIGCIGSEKKATVIRQRLAQLNIAPRQIARLSIPIGISAIDGKHPAIVAASIVAQVLSRID